MTDERQPRGYDSEKYCGGSRRAGGQCRRPKGWGTPHPGVGRCKLHGGSTPTHVAAAEAEQAEQAVRKLGLDLEEGLSNAELLTREIARSAALVRAYATAVSVLEEDDLIWGAIQRRIRPDSGGGQPAIEITQGARIHPLVQLLDRERATLRQTIEIAHRCGIEDKLLNLAEMFGTQLGRVIEAILGDLDLSDEQKSRVPTVVPLRIREIAS